MIILVLNKVWHAHCLAKTDKERDEEERQCEGEPGDHHGPTNVCSRVSREKNRLLLRT